MTCCLWSFDDGELTQIISHAAMDDGHKKSIRCLCFGPPDSHWLATGSFDGSVKVWDLETFELKQTLLEHKRGVHSCASCLDSRMVVSGGYDKSIRAWDLDTGACFQSILCESLVYSVALSDDGARVVGGLHDGLVQVWHLQTQDLLFTCRGHEK
jgi:WD40 repeat protein